MSKDGFIRMVLEKRGGIVLAGKGMSRWIGIRGFDENLNFNGETQNLSSIVKIYGLATYVSQILDFSTADRELIWERKEPKKEMTLTDIEKELGYSVKIINESEDK